MPVHAIAALIPSVFNCTIKNVRVRHKPPGRRNGSHVGPGQRLESSSGEEKGKEKAVLLTTGRVPITLMKNFSQRTVAKGNMWLPNGLGTWKEKVLRRTL